MDFLRRLSDASRMGKARRMNIREIMRGWDKSYKKETIMLK
jgi:hypothetical protein